MAGARGLEDLFFESVPNAVDQPLRANKVTVVGIGQVGMACAYSLLTQQIVKNIVLADVMRDRLLGEVADLQHGGNFLPATITAASEDYHETEGSDICIITAGARQREGESRLELLGRNYEIFKGIIPKLVKFSPDTLFLVISNPCDILSYVTYKLSGLPAHRVIGSGTYLDSSRFRVLLAKEFNLNPQSVHGWILGEHGDSSVPVWSTVNIAGVPITAMLKGKDENLLDTIHHKVVGAAGEVIKLKGYTNWAIGAAAAAIVRCILHDEKRVLPLGTLVQGRYGIEEEVFLSIPVVLGRRGIINTIHVPLKEAEQAKLKTSARTLHSFLSELKFD